MTITYLTPNVIDDRWCNAKGITPYLAKRRIRKFFGLDFDRLGLLALVSKRSHKGISKTVEFSGRQAVSVWESAKKVASAVSPMARLIITGSEKASEAVSMASEKGMDALKEEVAKQELKLKFELQQAKIEQELAIAHRIRHAQVVEIEEFYDRSGKGQVGAHLEGEAASLGLTAEGKSVTKRVYRFTASHDSTETEILQITD